MGTRASDGGTASKDVEELPVGRSLTAHHGGKPQKNLVAACSAAVEELRVSRVLIGALENENSLLKERLETEKQTAALLTELNATRKAETDALRTVVAAKNETIAAKDSVIAAQEKLVETLKAKKSSPWKRIGDVLTGVAAGMVLR